MHHEKGVIFQPQAFATVDLETGVSFVSRSEEEKIGLVFELFVMRVSLKFTEVFGVIGHEFSDLILSKEDGFALFAPEHGPSAGMDLKTVEHDEKSSVKIYVIRKLLK